MKLAGEPRAQSCFPLRAGAVVGLLLDFVTSTLSVYVRPPTTAQSQGIAGSSSGNELLVGYARLDPGCTWRPAVSFGSKDVRLTLNPAAPKPAAGTKHFL